MKRRAVFMIMTITGFVVIAIMLILQEFTSDFTVVQV